LGRVLGRQRDTPEAGDVSAAGGFGHDRAKGVQESRSFVCALYQHAAAIPRIGFAACQIRLCKTAECAAYYWFGDIKTGGKAANRLGVVAKVTGQKDPELTGGQVSATPANQRNDCLAEQTDLGIGDGIWSGGHVKSFWSGRCVIAASISTSWNAKRSMSILFLYGYY
jgi:hypothetical protein